MRHEFNYPYYIETLGGIALQIADVTAAVVIEADESVACTDWYVVEVEILGWRPGQIKSKFYDIGKKHPLFGPIAEYARKYCDEELGALWAQWVADKPATVADRRLEDAHP